MCDCVHVDGCFEKGRASMTGRWRKQSHLGTPDLVLGARHRGKKKKEEIERGGKGVRTQPSGISSQPWCAPQGRAAVKGREKGGGGVIACAAMRLDLGFRKVRREREGACLHKIKNSHVDMITWEGEERRGGGGKRERERKKKEGRKSQRSCLKRNGF